MKKLCVLFGGASPEHDISIITGMQLAKNVEQKYQLEKIYLGLDNNFYYASHIKDLVYFQDKKKMKLKPVYFKDSMLFFDKTFNKKICDIECIINCSHGGVGEDGDLAGYFNIVKVPFTSSLSLSSHIAMDKSLTKMIVKDAEIEVIKGIKITKENKAEMIEKVKKEFSDNLIVKPNSLGSSIGVKACNHNDFIHQIDAIFEMYDDALVEERIVNIQELNQACFASNGEFVLSAIENPTTKSEILSFEDKYKRRDKSKMSDRILPAKISKELANQINDYTLKVYKTLNLNGVVRIDYIYDKDENKLYFNEVNTIPGSMSFYLYEKIGIDYITLVEKIINNATQPKKYSYFDTGVLIKNLI